MTDRPQPPREVASNEVPIVFVVDRRCNQCARGLTNLFSDRSACGLRRSARLPNCSDKTSGCSELLSIGYQVARNERFGFQVDVGKAAVHVPIVFITGHGDIPMSVKAMKAGAADF